MANLTKDKTYDDDADAKHAPSSTSYSDTSSHSSFYTPDNEDSSSTSGEGASFSSGNTLAQKEEGAVDSAKDLPETGVTGVNSPSLWAPEEKSKKGKKGVWGRMSRRKKGFFGGVGGTVVALIVFLFPIITGPFQFVHFAELLTPNFLELDEMSENRTGRLVRYMRYGADQRERRRLGIVGNRVADHIEAKLKLDGITIEKTNGGYMKSMVIDGVRIDFESDIDGKPKRNAEIRKTFKQKLRTKGYGRVMTAIMSRPLFYRYGVNFKPMGNVKKKLGEKAADYKDRVNEDTEKRHNDTDGGLEAGGKTADELQKEIDDLESKGELSDADQKRLEELKSTLETLNADGATKDGFEEARKSADAAEAVGGNRVKAASETIIDTFKGKGSLMVAAIGMGVCATKAFGDQALRLEYTQKYWPQIKLGVEAMSLGAQIKSGESVDLDQLGVLSERFYDEVEGSAFNAQEINYSTSGETHGVPPSPALAVGEAEKSNLAKLSDFFDNDIVTGACSLMGNVVVGSTLAVVEFGVSFFSFGIGAAAKVAAQEAAIEAFSAFILSPTGQASVKAIIGDSVDPVAIAGPEYGNASMRGSYYAANEAARDAGAFSLDDVQATELKQYIEDNNAPLYAEKSIYDRIFNPREGTSLISYAIADINQAIGGVKAKNFDPLSTIGSIWSSFASIFAGGKVDAQQDTLVYGDVPKIAFSVEEIESNVADDPWENENYLFDKYGTLENLQATFDDCFDPAPTLNEDIDGGYYEAEPNCSGNQEFMTDLYRYRVYLFDINALLSFGCYAGDAASCTEMGFDSNVSYGTTSTAGAGVVGDPYTNSTDVACHPDTIDLGTEERTFVRGNYVPMRLCALPNLTSTSSESNSGNSYYVEGADGYAIVNSRVSGAWYSLVEKYKQDNPSGPTLSATSSFRTMEHQKQICRDNSACRSCYFGSFCNSSSYSGVAKPGGSSHQAAVAIDFANMGITKVNGVRPGYKSGATCSNRATYSSDVYRWMNENAYGFGFKQYAREAWHWDMGTNSLRCTSPG